MKAVLKRVIFLILFVPVLAYGQIPASDLTEIGSGSPNSLATTTYDVPSGPNYAPGGPHKAMMDEAVIGGGADNPGTAAEGSPVGAPWVLLGFAATYAVVRLVRRKSVKE